MDPSKNKMIWKTIRPSDVEGRGWKKTEALFDRLPVKVKEQLPDVWSNSHSSTGMCVFFNTDSTSFHARWELGTEQLGEPNFNVCSHSGVDLYIYDEAENRWRWAAAPPHHAIKDRHPEIELLGGLSPKMRRCRLYLPMRNQILKLAVGVGADARFELVPPRRTPPLVYYGSSIIHGAFATRAGLGTAQILARNLDMPLINLGFSGAARLEKEMAVLLAELNARTFIIDPYHNLTPEMICRNTELFIDILCSARPGTPVLMLGAPQHFSAWLYPEMKKSEDQKTILYGKICRRMMKKYPNLHYLNGRDFYGSDDVSMDGVHPNDEAFSHMAAILTKVLKKIT